MDSTPNVGIEPHWWIVFNYLCQHALSLEVSPAHNSYILYVLTNKKEEAKFQEMSKLSSRRSKLGKDIFVWAFTEKSSITAEMCDFPTSKSNRGNENKKNQRC